MTRWEYEIIPLSGKIHAGADIGLLQDMGQKGWELVAVIRGDNGERAFLKRPAKPEMTQGLTVEDGDLWLSVGRWSSWAETGQVCVGNGSVTLCVESQQDYHDLLRVLASVCLSARGWIHPWPQEHVDEGKNRK